MSLPFTEEMIEAFFAHLALLQKWNRVYNLTAVRSLPEMIAKHVLDSLSVAHHLQAGSIADVGTGGGFPGIPLAILFPTRQVTLIEVNQKRVIFLKQVIHALKLYNVDVLQSAAKGVHTQHLYQNVISRAFSEIALFIEEAGHLVDKQGALLAMKGQFPEAELQNIPAAWEYKVETLAVPGLQEARHLVILSKKN